MKRNYHDYGLRTPMGRALLLAGVSDRTRAQVTLNVAQQAVLIDMARDLDLIVNNVRTEATVLSRELDNARKYIERLKAKVEQG